MSILHAQDIDVIADHINPNRQGWTREVTVNSGLNEVTHKIRATIYRDSYDFQSRIKVEVWAPAELSWNTIRTLAGEDHKNLPSSSCLGHHADKAEGKREIFLGTEDLVDELIGYAQQVLA